MNTTSNVVDQLNSFLRGEISAVESYRQAVEGMHNSRFAPRIMNCMRSHEQRVQLLQTQIQKCGGKPANGSGVWGTMTKLLEKGASVLGDKAAIAALEEGEDHGLRDYRSDLSNLDAESRQLIVEKILPEQQRTHAELSAIKRELH